MRPDPAADPTLWLPAPSSRLPLGIATGEPAGADAEIDAVGSRIGPNDHELFISCDASVALQQQFEQKQTAYIAWHDIGPAGSRRLLAGVAAAGRRPVQRLSVRRRGHGDILATLEFLELPTADGRTLRLYATDIDAPATDRESIARTLLAHARLTVLMLAGPALGDPATALAPLSTWMARPPWPGRHLLLLPLGPARQLEAAAQDLAVRHGVEVVATPAAHRPSEAWQRVQAAWARLVEQGTLVEPRSTAAAFGAGDDAEAGSGSDAAGLRPSRPSMSPDAPFPGFHAPPPPAGATGPITAAAGFSSTRAPADLTGPPSGHAPGDGLPDTEPAGWPIGGGSIGPTRTMPSDDIEAEARVARLLRAAANLPGFTAACVFELGTGRVVTHLGERPHAQLLARHGAALMTAFGDASRGLGFGAARPDALLTVGDHHLVVRPVAGEAGLGLHLVVDRHTTDLGRLRSMLMRLDALRPEHTQF